MQINSPDVPDLTVVDLPGTTTIPMKNQPQSIVADLENMALHYISDPNSIILAVTPANADVANSQALQLAGRVDPGVILAGIRLFYFVRQVWLVLYPQNHS